MAEVEIGLGAVVEDVDFAVLVRAHRARIDVDVGVEFLQADAQAAMFEQHADGGAGEPLAEGTDDAAGDENVFGGGGGVAAGGGGRTKYGAERRTPPLTQLPHAA